MLLTAALLNTGNPELERTRGEANRRLHARAASHYHRYTRSLEPSSPLMRNSLYANQETKNKMESRQTFPTDPVLFQRWKQAAFLAVSSPSF